MLCEESTALYARIFKAAAAEAGDGMSHAGVDMFVMVGGHDIEQR